MYRKKIQYFRTIVQIISFYIFTGLFALILFNFRTFYKSLVKGTNLSSPSFNSFSLVFIITILTILFGRFFCGWLCGFGALNRLIYSLTSKMIKKKLAMNKKLDSYLKYFKYLNLVVIVYFAWTISIYPYNILDPWNAFANMKYISSMFMEIPIAFMFFFISIIGAIFIERFYCRYICPLGAIQGILSFLKLTTITKNSSKCGECTLCTKKCPMEIDLGKKDLFRSHECIHCLKCISNCPKNNISKKFTAKKVHAYVYILTALLIFVIPYYMKDFIYTSNDHTTLEQEITVDNIEEENTELEIEEKTTKSIMNVEIEMTNEVSEESNDTKIDVSDINSNIENTEIIDTPTKKEEATFVNIKYNDGTFIGISKSLEVSVSLKNDKIIDIIVISHREEKGFYEDAFDVIPKRILGKQTSEVDVVSGATSTSNRLLSAVNDALKKAEISND